MLEQDIDEKTDTDCRAPRRLDPPSELEKLVLDLLGPTVDRVSNRGGILNGANITETFTLFDMKEGAVVENLIGIKGSVGGIRKREDGSSELAIFNSAVDARDRIAAAMVSISYKIEGAVTTETKIVHNSQSEVCLRVDTTSDAENGSLTFKATQGNLTQSATFVGDHFTDLNLDVGGKQVSFSFDESGRLVSVSSQIPGTRNEQLIRDAKDTLCSLVIENNLPVRTGLYAESDSIATPQELLSRLQAFVLGGAQKQTGEDQSNGEIKGNDLAIDDSDFENSSASVVANSGTASGSDDPSDPFERAQFEKMKVWEQRLETEIRQIEKQKEQNPNFNFRTTYNPQSVKALRIAMGADEKCSDEQFFKNLADRTDVDVNDAEMEYNERGINAFYLRQYLRAPDGASGDAARAEAIKGLEKEALNTTDTHYALPMLKLLALTEAIRKLQAATTPSEQKEALKELVALRLDEKREELQAAARAAAIDKFQSGKLSVVLKPGTDGLPVSEDGRKRLVAEARVEAAQMQLGSKATKDMACVEMALARTPSERQEAMKKLEKSAAEILKQGSAADVNLSKQQLNNAKTFDAQETLRAASTPKEAADALDALTALGGQNNKTAQIAIRDLEKNAGTDLRERLTASDEATRQEAFKDLRKALQPEQEKVDELRKKSAREILAELSKSGDPVEDADMQAILDEQLKEIEDWIAANEEASLAALDKYLDRSNPSQCGPLNPARIEAIAELEKLSEERMRVLRSNSLVDIVLRLKTIEANDDEAARNTLRVQQILRDLKPDSSAADMEKAAVRLREERRLGNQDAATTLEWLEPATICSRMNDAKNLQQIKEDLEQLKKLAAAGNPYARQALAAFLLSDLDDQRQRQWYANQNHLLAGKTILIPRLRDLSEALGDDFQALKKDAIKTLSDNTWYPNTPLGPREVTALALLATYASERPPSERDKIPYHEALALITRSVNERRPALDGRQPEAKRGEKTALDGLKDVLLSKCSGREVLVEPYMAARPSDPNFSVSEFTLRSVKERDPVSLSIVCRNVGDENPVLARDAKIALDILIKDPEQREIIIQELLAVNTKYGDRGQLLEVLGAAAALDGNITPGVRLALHEGLDSPDEKTSRSAVRGLLLAAPVWEKEDVKAVAQHLSPEMIDGLSAAADKMKPELRRDLIREISNSIDPGVRISRPSAEEKVRWSAALKALSGLARYTTEEDVKYLQQIGGKVGSPKPCETLEKTGFLPSDAADLQALTGRTLLAIMIKADDKHARLQALDAINENVWTGLEDKDLRAAIVSYVRGRGCPPELVEKVNKIVCDTGLPIPIATLFERHDGNRTRPSAPQAYYQDRAERAIANYETNDISGENFVRDTYRRAAVYNALPPELRKEICGTDRSVSPAELEDALVTGTLAKRFPFLMPKAFTETHSAGPEVVARTYGIEEEVRIRFNRACDDERLAEIRVKSEQNYNVTVVNGLAEFTKKASPGDLTLAITWTLENPVIIAPQFSLFSGHGPIPGPVEQFKKSQESMVQASRKAPESLAAARFELQEAKFKRISYDMAIFNGEYEKAINLGLLWEADIMAMEKLCAEGPDVLRAFAPNAYSDLMFSSGTKKSERSGLQRLFGHSLVEFPDYSQDSNPTRRAQIRYGQGCDALAKITPISPSSKTGTFYDLNDARDAQRKYALQAIDGHPVIAGGMKTAAVCGDQITALQKLADAGERGFKGQAYVDECKQRAAELRKTLKEFDAQAAAIEVQIQDLKRQKERITDEVSRQKLQDRIDALSGLLTALAPGSDTRKDLEKMIEFIESRDFRETSFKNWLRDHSITIVAVIAAVAICALTFGAGTPISVVIVAGAGIAVVADQGAKEGFYLFNHYVADTGIGKWKERSFAGEYIGGGAITRTQQAVSDFINGEGDLEKRANEFLGFSIDETNRCFDEFLKPTGREFLEMLILNIIFAGGGKLGRAGLKGALGESVTGAYSSKAGQKFATQLDKTSAEAMSTPAGRSLLSQWTKSFRRDMLNTSGFMAAQEGTTVTLQTALEGKMESGDRTLLYISAFGVAFIHGKFTRPNVLRLDPSNPRKGYVNPLDEVPLVKQLTADGHKVVKVVKGNDCYHEIYPKDLPAGEKPFIMLRMKPQTVSIDGKPIAAGDPIPAGKPVKIDGREVTRTNTPEDYKTAVKSVGSNEPGAAAGKANAQKKPGLEGLDAVDLNNRAAEFVEWHNDGICARGEYFIKDPKSGIATKVYVGTKVCQTQVTGLDGKVTKRFVERPAGDFVSTERVYEVLDALRASNIKPESVRIVNDYRLGYEGCFEPRLCEVTVNIAGKGDVTFVYNHETGHFIEFTLEYENLPQTTKNEYQAAYTKGLTKPGGLAEQLKAQGTPETVVAKMTSPENRFVSYEKDPLLYDHCAAEINAEQYAMYRENKMREAQGKPPLSYAELAKLSNRPGMKNYEELYEVNKKIFEGVDARSPRQGKAYERAIPNARPDSRPPGSVDQPKPVADLNKSSIKPEPLSPEMKKWFEHDQKSLKMEAEELAAMQSAVDSGKLEFRTMDRDFIRSSTMCSRENGPRPSTQSQLPRDLANYDPLKSDGPVLVVYDPQTYQYHVMNGNNRIMRFGSKEGNPQNLGVPVWLFKSPEAFKEVFGADPRPMRGTPFKFE